MKKLKVLCDHAGTHPRICPTCEHGIEHDLIKPGSAFMDWDCTFPAPCRMGSNARMLERDTRCVEVKRGR